MSESGSKPRTLLQLVTDRVYDLPMNTAWDRRNVEQLEIELAELTALAKEIERQAEAANSHLKAILKRKMVLEEQIHWARQGQLAMDLRPEPDIF